MVEDGFLEAKLEGRTTTALTLTGFGAFYLHSWGHFQGPDLLAFWRHRQDQDNPNADYINPQQGRPRSSKGVPPDRLDGQQGASIRVEGHPVEWVRDLPSLWCP